MNGGAVNYLRFALQDLVEAVTQDVEQQTDRLRETVGFAKQVLSMVEREQKDDRGSEGTSPH